MPQVDPVILQLKADVADYNRKVEGAARTTDQRLGEMERRGQQMGQNLRAGFDMAGAAAKAFVAAIAIDKIIQAANAGLNYAKAMAEGARLAGTSVERFQEVAFAAKSVGIETEKLGDIYKDVNDKVGDFMATGGGELKDFFENIAPKVGVTAQQFRNLSGPDALQLYVSSLEKAGASQAEMTFYMESLADDATKLLPILRDNGAGMAALALEANKLGIVLSSDQMRSISRTENELAKLNFQLRANIAGTIANNAGAIIALANALSQVVVWAGKAAEAFTRFKIAQGIAQQEQRLSSWFSSDEDKLDAINKIRQFQTMRDGMGKGKLGRPPSASFLANGKLRNLDVGTGYGPGVGTGVAPKTGGGSGGGGSTRTGGGAGASGPSAAELMHRLDSQLAGYAQQALSSMQAVATSTDERAELEMRGVEIARLRTLADIDADKDFSAAQKARLRAAAEDMVERQREAIDFRRKAEAERDLASIADAEHRVAVDALQSQIDMEINNNNRRRLGYELIDLEERYQRSMLEAIIASETVGEVEKKRAQIALAALNNVTAAKISGLEGDTASPGQRYISDLAKEAANIGDAFEEAKIRGLDRLNDSLSETVKKTLGLHGILGDIVGDFIQIAIRQALIRPLAERLFPAKGGGDSTGGILSGVANVFSSFFGGKARAGGGYVSPGQMYRVNEGASGGRVEAFVPNGGGTILPLGQVNQMLQSGGRSGPAVVQIRVVEGAMFEHRVQTISGDVSVQVIGSAAPALIEAATANTMAVASRPKL